MQERRIEAVQHERAPKPPTAALTDATAELHAAIDDLARTYIDGSAKEKAAAQDRFQFALAEFSAQIDVVN